MSEAFIDQGVETLAIGFPGQGVTDYESMSRLLSQYHEVAETVREAEEALDRRLVHILVGEDDPALRTNSDDQLRLYIGSVALWRTAENRGIIPDKKRIFYGASAGELAAAHAAEAYEFEQGLELVNVRGQEMHNAGIFDPGQLVVVPMPFDAAMQLAEGLPGVYAINENPGTQSVFAVTIEGAKHLKAALAKLPIPEDKIHVPDIPGLPLPHTERLAGAAEVLSKAVATAKMKAPKHQLIGNQANMLSSAQEIRDHLVFQLTNGVKLKTSARKLYDEFGVREFYDVGPGKVLYAQMKYEFRKSVQVVSVVDELLTKKK